MAILSVIDFISKLHPVLVHLPIGILVLAVLFQILSLGNRYVFLQPAIPVALFWGMIGAVISCISGYLLSRSGEYDAVLAGRHQWFGIAVAVFSLVLYLLHKLSVGEKTAAWLSVILLVLVSITGHLGGTLTHGEGYLFGNSDAGGSDAIKPLENVNEAGAYTDIIQPILRTKCYSCHGPSKQKGKLRLDTEDHIRKGGEDGPVLVAGKADESELVKRIFLPLGDEDHMPPKAKPQLTENEIILVHWWVSSGADFTKKVKELEQSDKVKPALASLQSGSSNAMTAGDIPATPVEKAEDSIVNKLRAAGVVLIPVAKKSNYLAANFVSALSITDSILQWLPALKKQLIWLRLDDPSIGDAAMKHVAACTSLTKLQLNNTAITDAGLAQLTTLTQLESLNLVGTKITAQGISQLKALKNLKRLFIYQTQAGSNDWEMIQKALPGVRIDTGRYVVPTLESDTTEVKF